MNKWIEIAKVGSYKEGNITESFLQKVVNNYDTSYFNSPITLDHKESGETYGRIEELKFENKSLYAKFSDIREELIKLIKTKAYTERSAEFYKDLDGMGPYLRAVSFVPFPAIKGMEPICLSENLPKGDYVSFNEKMKFNSVKKFLNNFTQIFKEERKSMLNENERRELEELREYKLMQETKLENEESYNETNDDEDEERLELEALREYKKEIEEQDGTNEEDDYEDEEEDEKKERELAKFCDGLIMRGKVDVKKRDEIISFMKKLYKDDLIRLGEGRSTLQFYKEQLLLVPDGTFNGINSIQKYSKSNGAEKPSRDSMFFDEASMYNAVLKYFEANNISFEEAYNKYIETIRS